MKSRLACFAAALLLLQPLAAQYRTALPNPLEVVHEE